MNTVQQTAPKAPDTALIEKLTKPLLTQSASFKIGNEEGFIASWALVERHDVALRRIGEMFDPFVDGLHKMHKAAIELRGKFLGPVKASKDALMRSRTSFRIEQERLAKIEADKKAEEQRKLEQKELAKEAKKLERAGNTEDAERIRETAAQFPLAAVPARELPKQAGSVESQPWEFEVENYDLVPIEFRTLDPGKKGERDLIDSKLRAVVSKLGTAMVIPGVKVWRGRREHSRTVR
jgi:hypothetical protein